MFVVQMLISGALGGGLSWWAAVPHNKSLDSDPGQAGAAWLKRYAVNATEGPMNFEIVGEIEGIETFAVGRSIREIPGLRKIYGPGRWRKRKGFAVGRLPNGIEKRAKLH